MNRTRSSYRRGQQMKMARVWRKKTQSELCKDIDGVSQSNLSKFENGFCGFLTEEMTITIMKVLHFPIEFLDLYMPKLNTSNNINQPKP